MGLVIGKGGETIKKLQDESGAKKVQVAADSAKGSGVRNVFVEGDKSKLMAYHTDLANVPYGENNDKFEINAELIEYESIEVWATEVRAQFKVFMGSTYGQEKYMNYDDRYDPTKYLKFGDMGSPNLSGNWE